MNKILKSGIIVLAVATIAGIATYSYFSDTETSTGNTFTAGSIDLKVDSTQHYNGNECVADTSGQGFHWSGSAAYPAPGSACDGTWPSKNLNGEKFFNFNDLKPGDIGENTVSLIVNNNDSWMCGRLAFTSVEELGKYLNVFWWIDDGDNIYKNGEKVLYGGPRTINDWYALGSSGVLPLTFADSYLNWRTWPTTPGNTLSIHGNTPQYLGVGWCFGALTVTGSGNPGFTCNGSGNQNDAQGKKVTADLTFSVEQSRNNPGFRCPENLSK